MRSDLFGKNLEAIGEANVVLQNKRMLKVRRGDPVHARQGSMVAYQGAMEFTYEGGRRRQVHQESADW